MPEKELAPHQQLVIDEKAELDKKLHDIEKFMDSDEFFVVCNEYERIRMINQENAMRAYSEILGQRISAF